MDCPRVSATRPSPSGSRECSRARTHAATWGYDGPLGTEGRTFHYTFRFYALDQPLDVSPGLEKKELERAMADHVLEEAELDALYERSRG